MTQYEYNKGWRTGQMNIIIAQLLLYMDATLDLNVDFRKVKRDVRPAWHIIYTETYAVERFS